MMPVAVMLPYIDTKTKILLEVEDGVIAADKPVTAVKDVLVVANVSVFAVLTTCKTWPAAAFLYATQLDPSYVNNKSVSVS